MPETIDEWWLRVRDQPWHPPAELMRIVPWCRVPRKFNRWWSPFLLLLISVYVIHPAWWAYRSSRGGWQVERSDLA